MVRCGFRFHYSFSFLFVSALASAADPAPRLAERDLVEIVDISAVTVSPDASHVAFRVEKPDVAANTVRMAWYVQRVDGRDIAKPIATPARQIGIMRDSTDL